MVTHEDREGVFILHFSGEINIDTTMQLRRELEVLNLVQQRSIVIDLAEVDFFDSSGLGYMIVLIKAIRVAGNNVLLCRPNRLVRRLLETVNRTGLMTFFDTLEEAMTSFTPTVSPAA